MLHAHKPTQQPVHQSENVSCTSTNFAYQHEDIGTKLNQVLPRNILFLEVNRQIFEFDVLQKKFPAIIFLLAK